MELSPDRRDASPRPAGCCPPGVAPRRSGRATRAPSSPAAGADDRHRRVAAATRSGNGTRRSPHTTFLGPAWAPASLPTLRRRGADPARKWSRCDESWWERRRATIDKLDVSGRSWDLLSSDGTQVVFEVDGPAVLWAGNDVERAAADEAGLPHLMYVEEGTILLRLTVDPATGESTAVDGLQLEADVVDLCGVLDEAADD
jgi:hypothetical protein